jgi:hypothetical protein
MTAADTARIIAVIIQALVIELRGDFFEFISVSFITLATSPVNF